MKKLLILLFLINIVYGKTIDDIQVIKNSVKYELNLIMHRTNKVLSIEGNLKEIITNKGEYVAFVQELSPQGFIVISASDETQPLIAYSTTHNFPWGRTSDNIIYNLIESSIEIQKKKFERKTIFEKLKIKNKWENTKNQINHEIKNVQTQTVWPASGTTLTEGWVETLWNQRSPYNDCCPYDNVNNDRSVVGCVATAMAQIINFHRYPSNIVDFNNSDNYTSDYNNFKYNIDEDCGENGTYKWDELNNKLDNIIYPVENTEIIDEFCYAVGVSVKMQYSSTGSAASISSVPMALIDKFNYSSAEEIRPLQNDFFNILKNNMKMGLPAELGIYSKSSGHAVVVDGFNENSSSSYEDDLYHLNYGWGRQTYCFWCNLLPYDNIEPELPSGYQSIGGAVVNIKPNHMSNQFWIKNNGNSDLIVTNISPSENWISLNYSFSLPLTLSQNAEEIVGVEINWNKIVNNQDEGQINISTNDPNQSLANVNVTAIPDAITYIVATSRNPASGGTTSGDGTYDEGEQVTVTAKPSSGWSFDNWTESGSVVSINRSYSFSINENRNLVANFKEEGCQPNWVPVIYTNNTTAYGKVMIEGIPAESGDVVGAFVGNECRAAGDVVVSQGEAYVTLLIQGEQVETVNFKIFDSSECQELTVNYTTQTNPSNSIGNPPNYLTIYYTRGGIQNLTFDSGWNLKSFYVTSDTTTPKSIFRTVASVLEEVKDLTKSYNPSVPDFLNTLSNIEFSSGYWVKVSENTTLDVEGIPVDYYNLQILLKSGWNLVGYPCEKENGIKIALSSIMSELEEVKDLTKSYNPSVPDYLNTLTKLVPGTGYWMKVKNDVTLTYPTPSGLAKSANIVETIKYDKWKPEIYTNSMVIYTQVEIDDALVSSGLVGAFIENECRGIGTIINHEGNSYATIVVNGDKKNKLTFKIFDESTEEERVVENQFDFTPGETESKIILLKGYTKDYNENLIPRITKLNLAYPNPFNPTTEIKFDLHEASIVNLSVYNLRGELVKTITNNYFTPGSYKSRWSGNNNYNSKVSSGVYIIQLITKSKSQSNKVILLK